ncbi:hypothetical protein RJT34_25233 [Clitoria ternatea]|uniref:FAF domain-containing protein n=1 Tax=Clitoria ternatea TaxID=43366 RepID=A0AAN9FS59_CLITE
MAAIVCRGLQSHLESQLVESRTLRSRLPVSPQQPFHLAFNYWDSNFKKSDNEETNSFQNKDKSTSSNLSFFEALSNVSHDSKEPSQKETTYVHPQQKRSSLRLSPKSLELCTENLGNESGTDIAENGIDMLSSSNCSGGNTETREQRQPRQLSTAKKAKTTQNFPPPLTTIRGSESLRVRPHREDGRLVIEVTRVPPTTSCFHAQRSHGRLQLCFLKNNTPSFDPEDEDDVEENEPLLNEESEEEEEEEFESETQIKDSNEDEDDKEVEVRVAVKAGEEETEDETEPEENVAFGGGCAESDVIMKKYERPRRCKEGGEHENNELLLNWSEPPLCVATS